MTVGTSSPAPSRSDRASQTARIALLHVRDRLTRPRARLGSDVPAFASAVTAEWLTAVLCPGYDARVVDWSYEPVSRGTSCRGRYRLDYAGADAERLPPTVFVKSASTFGTRMLVGAIGAIRAESRFYLDVKPNVGVLAPDGYFGASDRRTGRGILLIEDITRTHDVVFGDNRSIPLDRAMASQVVDTLATLQGSMLDSPLFNSHYEWVISSLNLQIHLNSVYDYERRTLIGLQRAGDLVPEPLRRRGKDIHRLLMKSFALDDSRSTGLVHTDVHAGNWFIDADRGMGLYDWAGIARGQGVRDLSYALMSALSTERRREWERELVIEYGEKLAAVAGRPSADPEQLWTDYRRQTLHALCFWLYTLGRSVLQPTMQADTVTKLNIERMAQAVDDLDTLAALEG